MPRSVGLAVEEASLDLGTIWEREELLHTLLVRNNSVRMIEIAAFRAACRCISVQPCPVRIAPGEAKQFEVRLDLTPMGAAKNHEPSYPFATQVIPIICNMFPGTVSWTLRGKVRRALELSARSIDFDESLVSGFGFPSKTVEVRCLVSGAQLSGQCDERMATIHISSVEKGSQKYEVRVLPSASLPVGKHTFFVHLRLVRSSDTTPSVDLNQIPVIPLYVRARVFSQVRVTPEHIYLGGARVGELLHQTITVTSVDVPFVVSKVESSPENSLTVERLNDPRDGRTRETYRMALHVMDVGSQRGEIRFFIVRGASRKREKIVATVHYEGFAPAANDLVGR